MAKRTSSNKHFLVIAAHPDDEIYGCGATATRLISEGWKGHLFVATEGSTAQYPGDTKVLEAKKRELANAAKIIGFSSFEIGNLPDMRLDTLDHVELNQSLSGIIRKRNPSLVFTHHQGDVNLDHTMIYHSTLVATRPVANCSVEQVLCYEVPSSTEWDNRVPFNPNTYYGVTKAQLNKKIRAIKAYKTEIRSYPHPRSPEAVEAYAKVRGSNCGKNYAEAFELVRQTR